MVPEGGGGVGRPRPGPGPEWGRARGWGGGPLSSQPPAPFRRGLASQVAADVAAQMASRLTPLTLLLLLLLAGVSGPFAGWGWDRVAAARINPSGPGE